MNIRYTNKKEKNIARKFWEENFDDNKEQIDFYFSNIFDNNNFLVLEENNIIKSSLHENPYILSWNFSNKKKFETKYIVGVSTDKKERHKGYMKNLIIGMLKNLKKENLPFVFLNPINPILYRQYGFEYFSSLEKYNFDINLLEEIKINKKRGTAKATPSVSLSRGGVAPKLPIKSNYNLLEYENKKNIEIKEINLKNYQNFLKDLISIYNFSMQDKNIYLERNKYYFKKLLLEVFTDDMKVFILYKDNKALSYIIFGFDKNKIEVRECFSKNIESKKQILYSLISYKDEIDKIYLTSEINSNLDFLFENQLKIEKKILYFMMLRIINPLILLEKYKNIFKNLSIFIKDEILEENTGIYNFTENNKIEFSKDNFNYDLEINIGDLGQLLSGFLSFDDLIKLEKIKIKNLTKEKNKNLSDFFTKKNSYLYELI